jgi:hypothetical protein
MEEEKNQETYLSRIENNSASTVSSLSFKSASYQSLSTQSKLCNMRNSVTRCFICDPKKKGLSANEKERYVKEFSSVSFPCHILIHSIHPGY